LIEAINSDLRTQIQYIEDVLKSNSDEQEELKAAVSRLTMEVENLNRMAQGAV
jgi:hypothetical protein